ncbi:hypothetical protein F5Y03DRAFT_410472 [Xylaria venustula]|nr:hypothetical protein F5Y03DRAFT_410472 [Xylaria venustula]
MWSHAIFIVLALSFTLCGLAVADDLAVITRSPTKTVDAVRREIITSEFLRMACFNCASPGNTATSKTASTTYTSCTTNALGLVSPQPSAAVCGVPSVSNGGTTLVSYSSGLSVLSLANCKDMCLNTVGCTNVYFDEGKYCNLHAGEETHVASSNSIYKFYDSTCFICPPACASSFSPPADAICNVQALSHGGTSIISYTSGGYVQDIDACGEICLATAGCTNLYFDPGAYCNLHAGNATQQPDSTSPYYFYEAACFQCPDTTTTVTTSSSTSCFECTPPTTTSSLATTTNIGTPWTSVETNSAKYNMALTTTFTQSPQCTGALITQMAWRGTNLWDNAINPVPTSTITTCYPSQFYSSVIGELNSVALPAFSHLVCPSGWIANMYNTTYGACCPSDFYVYAPYITDVPSRPFSGAACVSAMPAYQGYFLTSYDTTALLTTISTSAPADGTIVRVNAFDGIITGVATSTASLQTTTIKTSSYTTASCATPAATVSVTFEINYVVPSNFGGETINIVGNSSVLGAWNVTNRLPMSPAFYTPSNPIWDLTVSFNASDVVQYEYLLSYPNGTYTTTSAPYYNLKISAGCPTTETVKDIWR